MKESLFFREDSEKGEATEMEDAGKGEVQMDQRDREKYIRKKGKGKR